MKSSYYTGYSDLDEKLSSLYELQSSLEAEKENTRNIIKRQDGLLKIGINRDEAFENFSHLFDDEPQSSFKLKEETEQ